MAWQPISEFDGTTRNQTCSICGRDQGKGKSYPGGLEALYTTGIFIDFEGRFDVCHSCISEVAKLAGFVSSARAEKAEAARKESEARVAALEAELAEKTVTINTIVAQLKAEQPV